MNTDITALVKDIQNRVREVAYLMWESAGRHHGMAMEYWLAAEREVISTMQTAAERMIPGQVRGGGASTEAAPLSQASEVVADATEEATKAPAAPAGEAKPAAGEAGPVSQTSEAVVEASAATAGTAEAAGSTAPAAKAAARPTRKAATRARRSLPPGS